MLPVFLNLLYPWKAYCIFAKYMYDMSTVNSLGLSLQINGLDGNGCMI